MSVHGVSQVYDDRLGGVAGANYSTLSIRVRQSAGYEDLDQA
jgi:hypothetical protein